MNSNAFAVFAFVLLIGLLPAVSHGVVGDYNQDFELAIQADPDASANDGWLVFGNDSAPDGAGLRLSLGQDYVDPFNPLTRNDFTLERPGYAELAVDGLAGRRESRSLLLLR